MLLIIIVIEKYIIRTRTSQLPTLPPWALPIGTHYWGTAEHAWVGSLFTIFCSAGRISTLVSIFRALVGSYSFTLPRPTNFSTRIPVITTTTTIMTAVIDARVSIGFLIALCGLITTGIIGFFLLLLCSISSSVYGFLSLSIFHYII